MEKKDDKKLGLTTEEALEKLEKEIADLVEEHKKKKYRRIFAKNEFFQAITTPEKSFISLGMFIISIMSVICFLVIMPVQHLGNDEQFAFPVALEYFLLGVQMALMLIMNMTCCIMEEHIYRNEMYFRANKVLEKLKQEKQNPEWTSSLYPNLYAPISPCVTLQWTYRDGTLVNLPWALLVRGDVIALRPGQEAPGLCRALAPADETTLRFGDVYQPPEQKKEPFDAPRIRAPHRDRACVMRETPYLRNLARCLDGAAAAPAASVVERLRYLCTVRILDMVVAKVVIVVSLGARAAWQWLGPAGGGARRWADVYAAPAAAAVMPLLPMFFPALWMCMNAYGLTKFEYVQRATSSHTPDLTLPRTRSRLARARTFWSDFKEHFRGNRDVVARTRNIVHVFGTMSALCCVDKKGVLSWPNPTAEKVLFLREAGAASDSDCGDEADSGSGPPRADAGTVVEVLDLTHEQNTPFTVAWDDPRWARHRSRLAPLGLAALLNTCSPARRARALYAHLSSHIACEAMLSDDLVPVTNRRCLCALATQIGFTRDAARQYVLEDLLAVFRHCQADTVRFARSLQLSTKFKVPLPHLLAVLVRDAGGKTQLMSQGTADIILDSCVDYWNGRDLTPISAADRKKISDFYQRSSLTAYCTAFAYKPLTRGLSRSLRDTYLEVPAQCRPLYARLAQQWRDTPSLNFHSTDSLLYNYAREEDVTDAEGYFELQCNQTFIGLVTMQYQAQSDMVELIERLERACVRFVHFSKESELRSRVFSEKMGLESGWNCHISLADREESDSKPLGATRSLSQSAPGAINLGHATVKFTDEIHKPRHSITHSHLKYGRNSVSGGGGGGGDDSDSLLEADSPPDARRSLSCLTDSTDHSAPVHFDMSNRAKLPRGIDNVREHISRVDNVPLLVSLFTDCSARAVRRMLAIMQECGEVVCVLGAPSNCRNMEIFLQADASVAIEPLYPVLCQSAPAYELSPTCLGPVQLARHLNALPSSISILRDSPVSLYHVISFSRHFTDCLLNAMQFWFCAVCYISFLQVLALVAGLPQIFPAWGVLLLSLYAAALALAAAAPPVDERVMLRAHVRPVLEPGFKTAFFIFARYASKFLPSAACVLASYAAALRSHCARLADYYTARDSVRGVSYTCWSVYPVVANYTPPAPTPAPPAPPAGWAGALAADLCALQHFALALATMHLIVISASFLYRRHSMWQKGVWTHCVWCCVAVAIVVVQGLSSGLAQALRSPPAPLDAPPANPLDAPLVAPLPAPPPLAWLAAAPVLLLNELVKWQEIRADVRNQRRARLDFGTKLGMNSPF